MTPEKEIVVKPLIEEFKEKLEALLAEYPTMTLNVQHTIQMVETSK